MFRSFRFGPVVVLSGWVALAAGLGAAPATTDRSRAATELVGPDVVASVASAYPVASAHPVASVASVASVPPAPPDSLGASAASAGANGHLSGFLSGLTIRKPAPARSLPVARRVHPVWHGKSLDDDGCGPAQSLRPSRPSRPPCFGPPGSVELPAVTVKSSGVGGLAAG